MKRLLLLVSTHLNTRALINDYLPMTVGALILTLNFNIFLAPAKMAPGGVSGISIIVHQFTDFPEGMIMLAVGLPIMSVGFFNLGRFHFLTRTLFVTLLYTVTVDLLEPWLPASGITDDLLLNAVFGGLAGGIGTGLVYRGRGVIAGTGIISRVIQLKTGIPTSQLYMVVDGGIILILGLVFGWEKALYALLMLFIWGLATDYVLEGPSVVRTAFIITDSPHDVSQCILDQLGIGVTAWEGHGMYRKSTHAVLFCAVSRPDVGTLKNLVTNADPLAFIVIGQGHQSVGGILHSSQKKQQL